MENKKKTKKTSKPKPMKVGESMTMYCRLEHLESVREDIADGESGDLWVESGPLQVVRKDGEKICVFEVKLVDVKTGRSYIE